MSSRWFGALGCGLALACAFALGCGGNGPDETTGSGGAAGTGGTSGTGGSAAGTGGAAGATTGSGGAAGMSTGTGGAAGVGGTTRTGGASGSDGGIGSGGVQGTGGSFAGGAAGTGVGGGAGTGGKPVGGSGGTSTGGSTGACATAPSTGACSKDGYVFCGGTVCCPPESPHYCAATNLCYATEERAATACGGSGCSRCVAPVTGSCPSAPTGGACNGSSSPSYYCGSVGCCNATSPYFCSATKLCYKTSNLAFAACAGNACVACAPPCSDPPNVTSSEISDEICGGQPLAMIDGIPAFAMCDAALNSNVWSSTGGDTAAMSQGAGWVETGGGPVGTGKNGYQCTELAMRYFYFRFGICPWITGPAKDMCSEALPSTLAITTTPVHGDLIILPPGCNGAGQESGHVAVVDTVSGSSVTVVQQNAGTRGTATFHTDCAACFIHAVANKVGP